MAGSRANRKSSFYWQGLLILLPVAIVSVVGLMAIQRDRSEVEQEARRNAQELADQLASALSAKLASKLAAYDSFSDTWMRHQSNLAFGFLASSGTSSQAFPFNDWQNTYPGLNAEDMLPDRIKITASGSLVWPAGYDEPPQTPQWFVDLNEKQREAWDALGIAELTDRSSTNIESKLQSFIETRAASEANLNAEFISVRSHFGDQSEVEVLRTLKAFAEKCPGSCNESGLPLLNLVGAGALQVISKNAGLWNTVALEPSEQAVSVHDLLRWILQEPSMFTPSLLEQLGALIASSRDLAAKFEPVIQAANSIWSSQQRLHQIGESLHGQGSLAAPVATNFWLDSSTSPLFCRAIRVNVTAQGNDLAGAHLARSDDAFHVWLYPKRVLDAAVNSSLRDLGWSLPGYIGLTFTLEQRHLAVGAGRNVSFEARPVGSLPVETPRRRSLSGRYYLTGTIEKLAEPKQPKNVLAEVTGRLALPSTGFFGGATVYQTSISPPVDVPANAPAFKLQLSLVNPELLFAKQRQRSFLFGALILASALAACVGLAAAYRSFRRQLRLNELKSNFVSSVSHELRAPIASVRLMAESLERGKIVGSAKQQEYFKFIVQECRRLSSLIENVLDFSRIEQGRKQFEFEPTDLLALTRQTVRLMEAYATERQVALVLEIKHEDALSKAGLQPAVDGKALQQALINLIDNAVKHSTKGQTVTIGLEVQNGESGVRTERPFRIDLWVEDHGEGIPAEEHEKIFERFYRLGSELRRQTQGVGIGLSIVKHVVEAHGGRVRVRSAVGQGSRFTIELPLRPEVNRPDGAA